VYVSHLSLLDFRSYAAVDVELPPGPAVFVGHNGQGKTNLVEAIGYVATLGSHRVASDAPLVRVGAARAVVRARIVRGERASTVEVEITPGKANRARINRGQLGRARDVLGILRTVLFAPEDLGLVKGDPDGRRALLDRLMVQLLPRSAGLLADYDKVVRQRSALLKSLRGVRGVSTAGQGRAAVERAAGDGAAVDRAAVERTAGGRVDGIGTLAVWDERAAQLGAQLLAMRLQLVDALRPLVAVAYAQVSESDGEAEIGYRSSVDLPGDASGDGWGDVSDVRDVRSPDVLEAAILAAMARSRAQEIERGATLVGPHRDDLVLTLGGLPAKGYASHGQAWSFALALRLASYRLLGGGQGNSGANPASVGTQRFWHEDSGDDIDPVLILDDVFAELDVRRRDRLAALVADARQVIVTAAVAADVPAALTAAIYEVADGTVTRMAGARAPELSEAAADV
jgi:DNA replication and repair protein RecF